MSGSLHSRLAPQGMTLIELLVVLIIMAILASVTFRAMDITRERQNYEKTMRSMEKLSIAIAGNPALIAEGRRTDFGFVGDMGRLPSSLDELQSNTNGADLWNGPYVRMPFAGDSLSFRTDAWGNEYQYLPEQAAVMSLGNGKSPITYRVVDDTAFLFRNSVRGTITDDQGAVPGTDSGKFVVSLTVPDPNSGQAKVVYAYPHPDGSYAFDPQDRIPVGIHRMVVASVAGASESLTKWVTVTPRVGAIVDFRLATSLGGALILDGLAVSLNDSSNVTFDVFNTGADTIVLDSAGFFESDDSVFCSELRLAGSIKWDTIVSGGKRAGDSTYMPFTSSQTVNGRDRMRVELNGFKSGANGPSDTLVHMKGRKLQLAFSDGSVVSFTVQ